MPLQRYIYSIISALLINSQKPVLHLATSLYETSFMAEFNNPQLVYSLCLS